MTNQPDSNYSPRPWMQDLPVRAKPDYQNADDRLAFEALLADLSMTADQIRLIRPTVGNEPFPPRTGYQKTTMTIMDVLRIGSDSLISDTPTRQDSGMQGSVGPSLGAW